MYHPVDPNDEFIELVNIGPSAINLNLVRFTKGVDFTFGSESLDPDERILVVRNQTQFFTAISGQLSQDRIAGAIRRPTE